MNLSGWGRYPRCDSRLIKTFSARDVIASIAGIKGGAIARGCGRSYGDAAIGREATISLTNLDHMRHFDVATCDLTVEGGVRLEDVIATLLPRGFFPWVLPGTKYVTIGGMIAADVHGKNHHGHGGFGRYVQSLTLALPDGQAVTCSRNINRELFVGTIGGMGLTGIIIDATFKLRAVPTGWILQSTTVARGIEGTLDALDAKDEEEYSVGWFDAVSGDSASGQALIFGGDHATKDQVLSRIPSATLFPKRRARILSAPLDIPLSFGRMSAAAFNALYFRSGASREGEPFLTHWDDYFFPLDRIANWNRFAGRRGLIQHQSVIPENRARAVLPEIVDRIRKCAAPPLMTVLKKLSSSDGLIGFPLAGYTLAVDLAVSHDVFRVLEEVDQVVLKSGGRLYLAKDARQSRATFEAGYSGVGRLKDLRRTLQVEEKFASRLSTRLGI